MIHAFVRIILFNFANLSLLFRCELRRIQDTQGDVKAAFLLRMIDIANRRRWSGNYFFYRDQDCVQPTYGVELKGNLVFKSKQLTFNITSLNIAMYTLETQTGIPAMYNRSCPGQMTKSDGGRYIVYKTDKSAFSNTACLNALGLDKREFIDAFFETLLPGGTRKEELFQNSVDLRLSSPRHTYQSPLVHLDIPRCITCVKVSRGNLKRPPKLYKRNSTSLNGVWGSVRCLKENRAFYTTRIDKFDGNKFESSFYQMDHSPPQKCDSPYFELLTAGNFSKFGKSMEVPGGVIYKMTFNHAYLTPYTNAMTNFLNLGLKGTCGKEVWETGKTQDLLPTKGCTSLKFSIYAGMAALVLIRTVHDENRNEMYFGLHENKRDKKRGPLQYDYITQDCSTFPIEMTTTPGPTQTTTVQTTPGTSEEQTIEDKEEEELIVNNIRDAKPTNKAASTKSVIATVVTCLLLYLQAVRHV